MGRKLSALLFAAFAASLLVSASQDKNAYRRALANFSKKAGSRDAFERADAVEMLGEATYPAVDGKTAGYVVKILSDELGNAGGPAGKNEEKVSGDVLEACVDALRRIRDEKTVVKLVKMAERGDPRFRFYLISSLGAAGVEKAHEKLVEFADDRDPLIQIAALDALADEGNPESLPLFCRAVGDEKRTWEAKLCALAGVEKTAKEKDPKAIDPLIEALGKLPDDQARVKVELMRILNRLMGTELRTDDADFWKMTWKDLQNGKTPGDERATTFSTAEFFGLTTRSTRIIFVLDRTGSMEEPGSEPRRPSADGSDDKEKKAKPEEGKIDPRELAAREQAKKLMEKYATLRVNTKMDALKKEYIRTVFSLDPRVHFTTVWYESNAMPWKEHLVPATWQNKLDAMEQADKMNPGGMTNIWDALEAAMKFVEQAGLLKLDKKRNYATCLNGADTLFLMTDGQPNAGRVAVPFEILGELRKLRRIRKLVIHTVCLGDAGAGPRPPDPAFLKKIADENGGKSVHVTER